MACIVTQGQVLKKEHLGLMLYYGLLEILSDFIFELVFCQPQMSHVTIERGHEQHRHVRLQLACAWAQPLPQ